jgi:hypothetical protein
MYYEAVKKRAEPYNNLVGEQPEMRRDTIDLIVLERDKDPLRAKFNL